MEAMLKHAENMTVFDKMKFINNEDSGCGIHFINGSRICYRLFPTDLQTNNFVKELNDAIDPVIDKYMVMEADGLSKYIDIYIDKTNDKGE